VHCYVGNVVKLIGLTVLLPEGRGQVGRWTCIVLSATIGGDVGFLSVPGAEINQNRNCLLLSCLGHVGWAKMAA
jgi:hypothetical protein